MAAAALIPVGASIIGGLLGKDNASKARKATDQLGREALGLQGRMFDMQRADSEPWRTEGGAAIHQLGDMIQPGYDYTASPGYEWRRAEGQRGVEGSAAARGILQSSGTLKGLARYNQNFAANDFSDQFNRVASVAQGGQQANQMSAAAGSNYGATGASILNNMGQARASGYAGQNAAVQGTLGNLFSLYSSGAFGK